MHILKVGLNHKTAPVEIREKVSFQPEELEEALTRLRQTKSILECVIVSTCNRTEIYAVADQLHTGRYYIKAFLAEWFSLDKDLLTPYLTIHEREDAVEHLFKVACGLDSMILGETQILGQVRSSFFTAQEMATTGTVFNELFKKAITMAKRSHSETDIGENAVSVSYAAVELAKKIFGGLEGKRVLILGAGKMGELTAKHLHSNGVKHITVMNRTYAKAYELAARFDGQARSLDDLNLALQNTDIVISSTGSIDYVMTKSSVAPVLRKRNGKPLFMVDIAVPRDLSPDLQDLESVFLYDIDDLEGIVEANLAEREKEAAKVRTLIEEELLDFLNWVNTLGVVPLITALRQKALSIQSETMTSIERKLPDLTDRERKVLSKHTKSIVNQLLRDPVTRVKELAGEPNAEMHLDLFIQLFGIEDEVEKVLESERHVQTTLKEEAAKEEAYKSATSPATT
ncbi:glutamyl-tRNA reductase [Alkalihalobacillus sp. AL-G]|uniref:glutamyl-tRNA reductase n=1 Tax=Alkalihalobacillus sp. AL-G TaxID=2926399 RepID=UPI00272BA657|nr:glutamyl-tRNA reductase [Alkalihalobacillus sp. AL-G]WLD92267.1 glutamyl-tRNA reductase [Alkalihalobacillus sp. AL-G]